MLGDDGVGVDGVLAGSGAEEVGAGEHVVDDGDGSDDRVAGLEADDEAEAGDGGGDAGFVDGGGVHAGGEVVTDLLLDGVAVFGGGCVLEDSPEELLVLVGELGVDAPGGLVGGDGVVLLPASAGELVEVDAGVDGAVEVGEVERGRVGHRLQRLLGGPGRMLRLLRRRDASARACRLARTIGVLGCFGL